MATNKKPLIDEIEKRYEEFYKNYDPSETDYIDNMTLEELEAEIEKSTVSEEELQRQLKEQYEGKSKGSGIVYKDRFGKYCVYGR